MYSIAAEAFYFQSMYMTCKDFDNYFEKYVSGEPYGPNVSYKILNVFVFWLNMLTYVLYFILPMIPFNIYKCYHLLRENKNP